MTDLPAEIPDIKEISFQVWAFIAGRNAAKTARILQNEPDELEAWERPAYPDISARTIRDWVNRYHWEERVDRTLRDAAPGIHSMVTQEIITGSVEAVSYLRDVVRGKDDRPDKVRVDAAKTFLDRAGFLPWTRNTDGSVPKGPSKNYDESVAGLSTADLMKKLGLPTQDPTE